MRKKTSVSKENVTVFKLTLRDGNVMSGTSDITSVTLITDYGKLEVPIKNVSSLNVGLAVDKNLNRNVENLIKQLANSNEQSRETAYDELMRMGIKAIPSLAEFIYSSKYSPSTYSDYNADKVLSDLQSKFDLKGDFSAKDIIVIDSEYSIGGNYAFEKIDLKTEYGILTIPREKIKQIDIMYAGAGEGDEMTFKLLGSKHICANTDGGWLKTGIMVKSGQKLNIIARGEITFASLSGKKYKPDGTISEVPTGEDTNHEESAIVENNYPTYANVVFKIGEKSTEVIRVGTKFIGKAYNYGMLYISIYETVYDKANKGAYTVKVKVK